MTPRPAVALNLAQLVALDSQSRFSRRKRSTVVPAALQRIGRLPHRGLLKIFFAVRERLQ